MPTSRARLARFSGKTREIARPRSRRAARRSSPAPRLDIGDVEQMPVYVPPGKPMPSLRAPWTMRRRSRRCRRRRHVSSTPSRVQHARATRCSSLRTRVTSVCRSTSTPASASRSISRRSCSSCGKISAIRKRTDAFAHVAESARAPPGGPPAQRFSALDFDARASTTASARPIWRRTRACAPARPARATSSPAPRRLSTIRTRRRAASATTPAQDRWARPDDQDRCGIAHVSILRISQGCNETSPIALPARRW